MTGTLAINKLCGQNRDWYSGREDRVDWRYLLCYKRLYQIEKDFINPKKSQRKKRKHNSPSKEKERKSVKSVWIQLILLEIKN